MSVLFIWQSWNRSIIPLIKPPQYYCICDIFCDVLHHLTLASCSLSCSVKALVSQCSACGGLCLLARLLGNRWGDRSLGEGSRDTISGDRWLTILLRAGHLWDVLGEKVRSSSRAQKNAWIFKHHRETCKCKKDIFEGTQRATSEIKHECVQIKAFYLLNW